MAPATSPARRRRWRAPLQPLGAASSTLSPPPIPKWCLKLCGWGCIGHEVVKITPDDPNLKIPHMGWNELKIEQEHALLEGIPSGSHAYFVHSFQLKPVLPDDLLATTDYGGALTAMVGNENIAGTQFHPEKSQATGIKLLDNFLSWRP